MVESSDGERCAGISPTAGEVRYSPARLAYGPQESKTRHDKWPELSSTSLRKCLGFFAENQRLTKQMGFGDAQAVLVVGIETHLFFATLVRNMTRL